jgi:hypothetical protein
MSEYDRNQYDQAMRDFHRGAIELERSTEQFTKLLVEVGAKIERENAELRERVAALEARAAQETDDGK